MKDRYKTDKEQLQSDVISWLRFPLIMFVAFTHTSGTPETLQNIDYQFLTAIDIHNIILAITHMVNVICNPGFFIFSGFLFFYKINNFNKQVYVNKLKKRVKTLIIPYLLWNVIGVLSTPIGLIGGRIIKQDGDWRRIIYFFDELWEKGVWNIFWRYNTWNATPNILGGGGTDMGPFVSPMWFLLTLITLSIATPIVYLWCRYFKQYGLVVLGIFAWTGIWFTNFAFEINAVFYFTLGAYLSINKKNMIIEFKRFRLICYIGFIMMLLVRTCYYNRYAYDILSFPCVFLGVGSAINFAAYLLEHEKTKVNLLLSKSSFFIYGLHTIFIIFFVGTVFDIIFKKQNTLLLTIRYFFVPIITVYCCVFIFWIMKKTMPKLLAVLAGGRI